MGRPEIILIAMHELSKGTTDPVQYEDLVVRAWELDRDAFGLRGYADRFPDSSDVHKPLYGPLKQAGYVTAAKKLFQLTEKGVAEGARLSRLHIKGDAPAPAFVPRAEMTRDKEREVERLLHTDANRLFGWKRADQVLDTDFFAYLGITARTPPGETLGRLRTVDDAINTAVRVGFRKAESEQLLRLHRALMRKFKLALPAQGDHRGH